MKRPPFFCINAWINTGTGNITLEFNRAPDLRDQLGMRKRLEIFLKTDGAGFSLHAEKMRMLMEPTAHTRTTIDIDESFVRDMLRDLDLGNDVPVRRKLVTDDRLNEGAKRRFTPIPAERLSAF